eukprot:scaffold266_cov391-Prasinococcus_capsulatus_cf.AAC.24
MLPGAAPSVAPVVAGRNGQSQSPANRREILSRGCHLHPYVYYLRAWWGPRLRRPRLSVIRELHGL